MYCILVEEHASILFVHSHFSLVFVFFQPQFRLSLSVKISYIYSKKKSLKESK